MSEKNKINASQLTNNLEHDAPLVALIGKSPADMTEEELDAHLDRIRSLRSTPQSAKKAVRTKKSTIDIQSLL